DTYCSCPDWANPCKHIAAVYFLLAERFDEDPFLIFHLRGRTKEEIINVLREKRGSTVESGSEEVILDGWTPLEECLHTFWEAGEELDSFVTNPITPKGENMILKRLGEAPFTVRGEDVGFLLSRMYDIVRAAALQKALEEGEISE
ncbi:MAG: SWIM zinc finger family protein, partial [Theionarchaea archaeon]|nr:SWIM zinc finger family protein [Theionarchaea archaeon]